MSGHWFREKGVELEKEPLPLVDQILGWVGVGLDRRTISIIVFIILLILVLVFLN